MALKEHSKKRKAAPVASTSVKKPRNTNKADAKTSTTPLVAETVTTTNAPATKEDEIALEDEDQVSEPEDDQTAALLKGFESSDEEEGEDVDVNPGEITEIPSIPDSVALQSKLTAAAASKTPDQPGVIYIGRIPHGFYEHQMRAYFSQFGDISRLRLSRNRKTGASKHYAFIEFASSEVAGIVADTMDNYLMFGHLLKVKLIPQEQVHEELFKGAGTRFKKIPWNRIERFRLQAQDREGWTRRVKSEEKRRLKQAQKLKELGYEFQAPTLRTVAEVPIQALPAVPTKAVEEAPTKAVEDVPAPTGVPKDEVALLKSHAHDEQGANEEAPKPVAEESSKETQLPNRIRSASKNAEQPAGSTPEKLAKVGKKSERRASRAKKV